jgi:uncharacterized membrane protein YgcG
LPLATAGSNGVDSAEAPSRRTTAAPEIVRRRAIALGCAVGLAFATGFLVGELVKHRAAPPSTGTLASPVSESGQPTATVPGVNATLAVPALKPPPATKRTVTHTSTTPAFSTTTSSGTPVNPGGGGGGGGGGGAASSGGGGSAGGGSSGGGGGGA